MLSVPQDDIANVTDSEPVNKNCPCMDLIYYFCFLFT